MDLLGKALLPHLSSTFSQEPNKTRYKQMIDIVDAASEFKLRDIVANNRVTINRLLSKLVVLSMNLDKDESNDPLISLRKISKLGMSKVNLFDKYKASDDIKFSILGYLNEMEIHSIMSNVCHDWNTLAKKTLNHPKFKYTFELYFDKLTQASSYVDDVTKTKVYVQCPWNRLWTYGVIDYIDYDHGNDCQQLAIEIVNKEYNPFELKSNIQNNKQNSKLNASISTDEDIASILTLGDDNNDDDDVKEQCGSKNNEQITKKDDFGPASRYNVQTDKMTLTISSDMCAIAPIGTLDKYLNLNVNCNSNNTNNSTNNNNNGGAKIINELIECANRNEGINNGDYFGRALVDVHLGFITENKRLCFRRKNKHCNAFNDEIEELAYQYEPDMWLCGIVDFYALEIVFPQWKDCNEKDSLIYQIPVLIDVTGILHDEDGLSPCNDTFLQDFTNLYKYGDNRYFTRIWFHPNRIQMKHETEGQSYVYPIQRFGTRTNTSSQERLLSSPMFIYNGGLYDNKFEVMCHNWQKENASTMENENINTLLRYSSAVSRGAITISELLTDYCIDGALYCSRKFDELVQESNHKDKIILFRDYDGELMKVLVVKKDNTAKEKEKEKENENVQQNVLVQQQKQQKQQNFDIIFENFYRTIRLQIDKKSNDTDFKYFYRLNSICRRPIIVYPCKTLMDQFDSQLMEMNVKLMIDDLMEYMNDDDDDNENDENSNDRQYAPLLFDIRPKHVTIRARKDDVWFKHASVYTKSDLVYENIDIKRCRTFGSNIFDSNKWRVGIWLCDKDDYIDKNYGFNEYLFDISGQIRIWFDITKEFNQFQEMVLKPEWQSFVQDMNDESHDVDDVDVVDDDPDFVEWDNRKYFLNCHSIAWNQKKDRIFCAFWVHFDDISQVARFGTHTAENLGSIVAAVNVNEYYD